MKLKFTVRLGEDRVTAVLDDGTILYDDVAHVALVGADPARQLIAAIGTESADMGGGSELAPALSIDAFRPSISAASPRPWR